MTQSSRANGQRSLWFSGCRRSDLLCVPHAQTHNRRSGQPSKARVRRLEDTWVCPWIDTFFSLMAASQTTSTFGPRHPGVRERSETGHRPVSEPPLARLGSTGSPSVRPPRPRFFPFTFARSTMEDRFRDDEKALVERHGRHYDEESTTSSGSSVNSPPLGGGGRHHRHGSTVRNARKVRWADVGTRMTKRQLATLLASVLIFAGLITQGEPFSSHHCRCSSVSPRCASPSCRVRV